jgi:hypothetical protein
MVRSHLHIFQTATLVITFFLIHNISVAQNCSDRIEVAKYLYDNGKLYEVIDTLKNCHEDSDENVRLNTHLLRSMAYLSLDQPDQARVEAVKLLSIDPFYKPSLLHMSKSYVNLIKSIKVVPRFSIGLVVSMGSNITRPNVEKTFSVLQQDKIKYKGLVGYEFGLTGLYNVNSNLAIRSELSYNTRNYSVDYSVDNIELNLEENHTYLSIPISMIFQPKTKGVLKPFAQIGLYGGILLESHSSYSSLDKWFNESNSLNRVSSFERRNKFIGGFELGFGIRKDLKGSSVSFETKYSHSLTLSNDPDARYDSPSLSVDYFHLDDDIYLHKFSFILSYAVVLNYKVLKK